MGGLLVNAPVTHCAQAVKDASQEQTLPTWDDGSSVDDHRVRRKITGVMTSAAKAVATASNATSALTVNMVANIGNAGNLRVRPWVQQVEHVTQEEPWHGHFLTEGPRVDI